MTRQFGDLYIGGQWVPGSGSTIESIDPYTGEAWYEFTSASESDVDAAVSAAADAFDGWRRTSGYERGRLVAALAAVLEENAEMLAEIETKDNGKLYRENRNQIAFAARIYRYMAGMADKIHGESKPLDSYATVDFTTREPVGVAALITGWNSPLQLLSHKLPAALAAGNTVVIKPSEYTTASTLEFIRLAESVGIPPGVVNVVTGAGVAGAALSRDPRLGIISFTGGVETAQQIATAAAQNIVPAIFELGGKSANIIFPDADLAAAIPGAVSGIFAAAGQTCVAGSRLLVHEDVYEQVIEGVRVSADRAVLGSPFDPGTHLGPMAHRAHFDGTLRVIEAALDDGARLVSGGVPQKWGRGPSSYVPPSSLRSTILRTLRSARSSAPCSRSCPSPIRTRRSGSPTTPDMAWRAVCGLATSGSGTRWRRSCAQGASG